MKVQKRAALLVSSLLLVVTLVAGGCGTASRSAAEEQARFAEFIQQDFVSTVEGSYTYANQFFEHPENFGISEENIEVTVGSIEIEKDWKEGLAQLQETERAFGSFDRSLLTRDQQRDYDIFQDLLQQAKQAYQTKFQYLEPLFTQNGLHYSIPQYFALCSVRTERDIEDTLTLMQGVPQLFDEAIAYTREQQKRGLLMIDFDGVLELCQEQIDLGLNHSALAYLKEQVTKLGLGEEKTQDYHQRLEDTFSRCILARYLTLTRELAELKDGDNHTQGLAHLKNGKAYYEQVLFRQKVGNGRSVAETTGLLEKYIQGAVQDLQVVARRAPEKVLALGNGFQTQYSDYESIIEALKKAYPTDFPNIKEVSYEIAAIPKEQQTDSILAFYVFNAFDATAPDQIRVNPSQKTDSAQTFMTIAHEGIPGHLYQHNYIKQHSMLWNALQSDAYLGYQEGYATYVQLYALQYLEDLDPDFLEALRISTLLDYALSARLDIGIQYEGWTVSDLNAYLAGMGMPVDGSEMYQMLQSMPGDLLSYGVGLIEMLELRGYAEEELGGAFTDLGFHEALLKSGPAPFSVVRGQVEEYVQTVKQSPSTISG